MRLLLFTIVSLILFSCSGGKSEKMLSQRKMKALLTEVHLLDGYLQTLSIDSSRKIMDTLYTQLLDKYGLDSVLFEENLKYYYADPIKTEKIYKEIQEEFMEQEKEFGRIDSIRFARERDSINRVYRLQNLLDRQRRLIHYNRQDSVPLVYGNYSRMFFEEIGIASWWTGTHSRYVPAEVKPTDPVQMPIPPEVLKELPRNEIPVESPIEQPVDKPDEVEDND